MWVHLNDRIVAAVYRAVPFVPGIFGVAAYLFAPPSARRVTWVIGLLIVAGLTAFTAVVSLPSGIALSRLLTAWTILYAVPMVLALAAVDGSRRVNLPRWVGVLAIVAVCVISQWLVRDVPFGFLDLVHATG